MRLEISLVYHGKEGTIDTIVRPTKIGVLHNGNPSFEGYWVAGESISGTMPPWRLYNLDKIATLTISEVVFTEVGPEYKPTDKRFKTIHENI